jgi:hypothetical protein
MIGEWLWEGLTGPAPRPGVSRGTGTRAVNGITDRVTIAMAIGGTTGTIFGRRTSYKRWNERERKIYLLLSQ